MSNPVKSVGKVFKKVAKAIKPLVKPLMFAAAVYFTGGAMGLWSTPLTTAAGGVTATGVMGTGTAGAAGAAVNTAGVTASGVMGTGTAAGATAAAGTTLPAALSSAGVMETGTAANVTMGSKIGSAAKSMLGFIDKHPSAGLIAGNMMQSAFTPTEAEQAMDLDRYRRKTSSYYGVKGDGTGSQEGTDVSKLFTAIPQPDKQPQRVGLVSSRLPSY